MMKGSSEAIGTLVVVAIFSAVWVIISSSVAQETTSTWWKTEIVRRGYGTWETTTDGQVWFKWKEQNTKEAK